MTQVRIAKPPGYCSQHHRPLAECDPDSRHSTSLRASVRLIRKVEAKAASLGWDRNAGMEAALEAWTEGTDEDAPSPLAELLAEVKALREQVSQFTGQPGSGLGGQGGTSAGWNQFGPPRTAAPDTGDPTLKFRSTDPDASPDVIPYPVPEPADRSTKKGRAKPGCGHHVAAGTRCKICQPAKP